MIQPGRASRGDAGRGVFGRRAMIAAPPSTWYCPRGKLAIAVPFPMTRHHPLVTPPSAAPGDDQRLARRDLMRLVGGAGLAAVSAFRGEVGLASTIGPQAGNASSASKYPPIPSWSTELRQ